MGSIIAAGGSIVVGKRWSIVTNPVCSAKSAKRARGGGSVSFGAQWSAVTTKALPGPIYSAEANDRNWNF